MKCWICGKEMVDTGDGCHKCATCDSGVDGEVFVLPGADDINFTDVITYHCSDNRDYTFYYDGRSEIELGPYNSLRLQRDALAKTVGHLRSQIVKERLRVAAAVLEDVKYYLPVTKLRELKEKYGINAEEK